MTFVALVLGSNADLSACDRLQAVYISSLSEVVRQLDSKAADILILGPSLFPAETADITNICKIIQSRKSGAVIIAGAGEQIGFFQDAVEEGQIFYVSRGILPPDHLVSLVNAAIQLPAVQSLHANLGLRIAENENVCDFHMRLHSQSDVNEARALIVETLKNLIGLDAAQVFIYDQAKQTLDTMISDRRESASEASAAGIVGFVALTGEDVCLNRAEIDPRYDAESDHLLGTGESIRLIARAVIGPNGRPFAVLSGVRKAKSKPFLAKDQQVLELMASSAAAALYDLTLRAEIETLSSLRARRFQDGNDLFREDALDHHLKSNSQEGGLLPKEAGWLRKTYWLNLALLVVAFVCMVIGKVDEYASGPAVVRATNRFGVTVPMPGLVQTIEVSAGEEIKTGDLLMRFAGVPPGQSEELRSPRDGIVAGIRMRAGQTVNPGEQALSIIGEPASYEVLALLPGSYAPQLDSGMPMLLNVEGFVDSHEAVTIKSVGMEIMGSREAVTYLGRENADALQLSGSVIIVKSVLPASTFWANSRKYAYRDGMIAKANVKVRTAPLLFSVIPGLRGVIDKAGLLSLR